MTQADVLTAIDDALDTGMATEPDAVARELQELALLLRADSPEPTDAYSEWLDERVSHEFASPREARSKPPWWRPLMQPAAAVLVIAVAVAGVGLLARGLSGASDDSGGSGGGVADSAGGGLAGDAHGVEPAIAGPGQVEKARSRRAADQALSGSSPAAVLPPHPGGEFAPGRADRRIERSFSLELESPVDEMQRVADQVTAVTNRHGGFVLSSSVSTGEDSSGGDFNLRIPASEVRPALRDLARLADVVNQSQTGRDVTPSFVTARDRLRSARAERKSLLRRLQVAGTDAEAEAIRRRLDIVAGQINGLQGRLHGLRLRTDYAVVTVSLQAKEGAGGAAGRGSFDDAMHDAGGILVGAAGILIRVLAVALPLGLIALLGWLAVSVFQRRRRESALV